MNRFKCELGGGMAYEDLLGASRGFEACFFLFFLLSREASILLICWAILLLKMLLLAIKIINMKTSICYSRSKPFICTPLLLFFILVAMMLAIKSPIVFSWMARQIHWRRIFPQVQRSSMSIMAFLLLWVLVVLICWFLSVQTTYCSCPQLYF